MSDSRLPPEFAALLHALEGCQIFQIDPHGRFVRWIAGARGNAAASEPLPHDFSSFFTERDRARGWPEKMLEWSREQSRCRDEGWRLRAGEERFWAEHIIATIRDDHDEVSGFMNVLFDANQHLATERAVHEADRRILEYQLVAEIGAFEVDPSTGHFLVTPEILRIMGVASTPRDTADFIPIPSKELFQHVHPDDATRLYFAPQSPQPVRILIRVIPPGEPLRRLELRSHPIQDREGLVVRRMGTIQDVTALTNP